ncbi:GIY-YIG nuclease family protein [Candidatus Poriferisodalis sp.]|uniref:GIY-YIG nuclease family protein n=1 Tax=Candidatus Poriferisodalis sp. TaxID=3101277 RepID=UPI003B519A79
MSKDRADNHPTDPDHESADERSTQSGYVYVATNPAMPGIVKIGSTAMDDPQSRISSLFNTSVPVPFEMEYAAAVTGDATAVEQALHKAFAPQRVHPKREFFEIAPEQPIAILQLVNSMDITEDVRAEVDAEQSPADRRARERLRRPRLEFRELGLDPGALLVYENDAGVRAEIVNGRQVRLLSIPDGSYDGLRMSDDLWHLSPLTAALLGLERNVAPTRYWLTEDGRLLNDVYNEVHGPVN